MESMDGLINGFNRFIDTFDSENDALEYYQNNLEYKENIIYQDNKILVDVVKCFIWNFNSGLLKLYFRDELKKYLTYESILQYNRIRSSPLKCQESRKLKSGSQLRYWFYFMTDHGYHIATDSLIIAKDHLESDNNFKEKLINNCYLNFNIENIGDINGIYYFDTQKQTTHLYMDRDEIYKYLDGVQYICVLDFEANCNETRDDKINEIIEFPSVLYKWNLNNNNFIQISEYQDYVIPLFTKTITEYCTNLTGITQEQVDSGIEFRESFQGHYDWLKKHISPIHLDYCTMLVTCGNWDLNTMLPKDCKRHGIYYYPDIYKRFINIKISYQNTFNTPKQYELSNMMKYTGLKMDGRHQSGIDDCRNTGKLFHYLINNGYRPNDKDIIHTKVQTVYKHPTYHNTIQ
jgi:inhibitor of KinA sporulation pathway (predicted exonuclease)